MRLARLWRAGLDVMDVPELKFRDLETIQQSSERAHDIGYAEKAALHPAGIAITNNVFTPSADEIVYANCVISAYDASPNGLVVVDGRLIEAPVIKAMKCRLAIAKTCGSTGSVRDE